MDMQDDTSDRAPTGGAATASQAQGGQAQASHAQAKRAEAARQRLHIAEQKARSAAAGGQPSADEAARLLAAYYAGGGRITICPPAEDTLSKEFIRARGIRHRRPAALTGCPAMR